MHTAALVVAVVVAAAGGGPSPNDALCEASRRGNNEAFAGLLERARAKRNAGEDLLQRRGSYDPALVAACAAEHGRATHLALVLDDVDAADRWSILDAAVCGATDGYARSVAETGGFAEGSATRLRVVTGKHENVFALLVTNGVMPSDKNVAGAACAAERGDIVWLRRFVVGGGVAPGRALHAANATAAAWLIEQGADVGDVVDCDEENGPTRVCAHLLPLDLVLPLADMPGVAGMNAHDAQWTALHAAALYGDVAVVDLLLAHKDAPAKLVNARTRRGFTPAMLAAWGGHRAILEKLFQAGAAKDAAGAAANGIGLVHLAALSAVSAPRGKAPLTVDDAIALVKWLRAQGASEPKAGDKHSVASLLDRTAKLALRAAAADADDVISYVDAPRWQARADALRRVKDAL